ncbi:hypothetical protein E2C01_015441 [Portunus trituberculatus]|uniref:Uncharacterized protein n=1 Tax=Portunus trituberculatus TaxID=210409 RepID=A0A5B7DN72_PORTR|nr:hypothetical protein [Portunus trituberculatus]
MRELAACHAMFSFDKRVCRLLALSSSQPVRLILVSYLPSTDNVPSSEVFVATRQNGCCS